MPHYRYAILGGGLAGDAAIKGIRSHDRDGSIIFISAERFPPYARPLLSKKLWTGGLLEKAFRQPSMAELGVDERLGQQATALDPAQHRLTMADGTEIGYDRLLLATGGTPRTLAGLAHVGGDGVHDVVHYRTMADYLKVRGQVLKGRKRFVVVGAGFIGTEMAAALAMNECEVTMLFPEQTLLPRVLPQELSSHVTDQYREHGVQIVSGDAPTEVQRAGDGYVVVTKGGRRLEADGVLAGLGLTPRTDLAEGAGIQVDNGIVVDEQLRTTAPDVYAAGDVARFPYGALGGLRRVEHEDNAKAQGQLAGANMTGAGETYSHQPFFYSDLFDMGFEASGELDSRMETHADWQDGFKKGVVYYLADDRVRGVLLWNVWDALPKAEALIREAEPVGERASLNGRI